MKTEGAYRTIFLFVSGRTPQIITETLFFFLSRHRPAVRPDEIHVLTTSEGKTAIVSQLLEPNTGQFFRFCRDYRLDPRNIRFSEDTIEVLRDEQGAPLVDIRSDTENLAAADRIVAKVRTLTSDPHTRLVASMAGGRKTMGLYLGFALQFYGRAQDRLTHVLVSPPSLESNPAFFYPRPRSSSRSVSQKTGRDQAVGEVTVAEVPLVFLGHKLLVLRERRDLRYAELVAQSQREVDLLTTPSPLTINRVRRCLETGEAVVPLSGLEFALFSLIASKRRHSSCAPDCSGCISCTVGVNDFLDPATITALEGIAAESGGRDPRLQQLRWWAKEGQGKQRFLQVGARIKQKVRKVLGEASGPYTIAPLQTRPDRVARYTIALPKSLIRFS
jgi:CRISPR-associated protein (TIGR02584 family)